MKLFNYINGRLQEKEPEKPRLGDFDNVISYLTAITEYKKHLASLRSYPVAHGSVWPTGDIPESAFEVREIIASQDIDCSKLMYVAYSLPAATEPEHYWYCGHCDTEVNKYCVTNDERHDKCGNHVIAKPVEPDPMEKKWTDKDMLDSWDVCEEGLTNKQWHFASLGININQR